MANNQYLRWDAQSIQELLRQKLLESGLLTDQLYPSSDTKILIDIFAWVFDVLTYMLNNAAADTLFNDTQLYENMNRIVKLLSYNPHGYLTSSTECKIDINTEVKTEIIDNCTIPKFTSIDLGKTDKYGNPIRYSFIEDFIFNVYTVRDSAGKILHSRIITPQAWPVIYNGTFKKYDVTFMSSGIPYEIFTLTGLNPNIELAPVFLDHKNFHVFIESINEVTRCIRI